MSSKVRRRTREAPEVRREKIIDETIRLIGQRGYYGFTVQEAAEQCGLSNAGLLYYFPSKDHLLIAVLEEFDRRETEIVAPVADFASRARSEKTGLAVRQLLRTIAARGSAHPDLVRLYNVLQAESLEPSHPAHHALRAREAKILKLLTEVLRPYVASPGSTARHLFALMDGLGQQWIRAGHSFNLLDEYTRALDSLLPQLSAPAGAKPTRVSTKAKAKSRKAAG